MVKKKSNRAKAESKTQVKGYKKDILQTGYYYRVDNGSPLQQPVFPQWEQAIRIRMSASGVILASVGLGILSHYTLWSS